MDEIITIVAATDRIRTEKGQKKTFDVKIKGCDGDELSSSHIHSDEPVSSFPNCSHTRLVLDASLCKKTDMT